MNKIKSDVELISESEFSQEEIMAALDILKKDKLRKEKKLNKSKDDSIFLKKKALRFINDNYIKYIILKEGEGYYIVAHQKKFTVITEFNQSSFQPVERREEKVVVAITILEYDKVDKNEIKEFEDIYCEKIIFKI